MERRGTQWASVERVSFKSCSQIVSLSTDQTNKFVKTPDSNDSSSDRQSDGGISPSISSVAFEGLSRTTCDNRAGVRKIHNNTAANPPPECSQKRLLIDESASPTPIRRMNGAEGGAIRVRRKSQFQSLFSDRFPVSGHTERRDETREPPLDRSIYHTTYSQSSGFSLNTYKQWSYIVQ